MNNVELVNGGFGIKNPIFYQTDRAPVPQNLFGRSDKIDLYKTQLFIHLFIMILNHFIYTGVFY